MSRLYRCTIYESFQANILIPVFNSKMGVTWAAPGTNGQCHFKRPPFCRKYEHVYRIRTKRTDCTLKVCADDALVQSSGTVVNTLVDEHLIGWNRKSGTTVWYIVASERIVDLAFWSLIIYLC
jgi:hypothetical protein